MVGASAPMREVYQFVRKAAPTNATVLILGESGTGKELLARAIHRNSPRADRPFVAINCAAVTETLLESEFFGHERGAFTGAVATRKGKLEQADGGSVFLDEIGELAPALQAKLLRVLQEREFERVGGTRAVRVDIRLIAATNRKLEEAVRQGSFRQDLYYRLNVVAVTMPPLRERQEDIPVLAHHFLQKRGASATRKIAGISEAAQACLRNYDWPGNVRELENAIERAIVLGTTEEILREDLPDSIGEAGQGAETGGAKFHETIREWKRQLVLKALEEARQNHAAAARLLGLHPNNLYRLLKSLNLKTG
jgi:Nif-specific regulatory protein